MQAYLYYPTNETGYDFAASHPAVMPGCSASPACPAGASAYDLLPGKRMTHYV